MFKLPQGQEGLHAELPEARRMRGRTLGLSSSCLKASSAALSPAAVRRGDCAVPSTLSALSASSAGSRHRHSAAGCRLLGLGTNSCCSCLELLLAGLL